MLKRLIFPLAFGLVGTSILLWLGLWQVDRLAWKQELLGQIEERIAGAPVGLPADPDPEADQYLSVEVSGTFGADDITVLASTKQVGAIYRIIAPFTTTEGRTILVDRGFVLDELRDTPRPKGSATLTGNLLWPDEIDSYTPAPDLNAGIWFAREIPAMAQALDTEMILLVVRETSERDNGMTPLPVDSSGIPNDHFEYAVTWFGLALVWVFMTGFMIWRLTRKNES